MEKTRYREIKEITKREKSDVLIKYLVKFTIIILLLLLLFVRKNNKFFFFEKNQDELKYCKNYGLLIYDYTIDDKTGNIGDYIQSLAALQYLPKECKPYLIDRDKIQFYNGPKVKLIMNGWHRIEEGNKFIPSQINPFLLSYHISNPLNLSSIYIENLSKFSQIGCRDTNTRDQLIKYGIKAFFSSCLTTTLDIDYSANENERTNDIIFTDYKFGDYLEADNYIHSLRAYNFSNIINITHIFKTNLTHIERFNLAKKLLDKYARAKLVITTRLHTALLILLYIEYIIIRLMIGVYYI